jgi:hypothetical protein
VIKYPTTLFNAIGPVEALSPGKRKSVLLPGGAVEGSSGGGKWRGEVEGGSGGGVGKREKGEGEGRSRKESGERRNTVALED